MHFHDRLDAARQLARALERYRGDHPLVLAIPRGAVPMGREIAERLGGDFDVVLVRKVGAPGNPEFALGAVDETGWTYVSDYAREMSLDPGWIGSESARQLETLKRRRALYSPGREPIDPQGRVCIVVDDGLATGATMIAALHSVRARKPARLVCAVPVASRESVEHVRRLADDVVCLDTPRDFYAVGQFYADFRAVEDDEVMRVLSEERTTR
ncbi:MAG TPA: phosphoribosyltransferase family protein [Usitatibacter sp.]|nr:phosphoribosyltransferase family protein [Usitatibacter sp.]